MLKQVRMSGGQLAVRNTSLLTLTPNKDYSSMNKTAIRIELVDLLIDILNMGDIDRLVQSFCSIPTEKLPQHQIEFLGMNKITLHYSNNIITFIVKTEQSYAIFNNAGSFTQEGTMEKSFSEYLKAFFEKLNKQ